MNKICTLAVSSITVIQLSAVAQENRPNIIYIMSDDHAAQAISAYGSRLAKVLPTPNIDRIANEGIRMNNCCVTNSISAPSRACIMTGQYSHVNGVYTLDDGLKPEQDNIAKELQKSGYQTAIIGKWHLKHEPSGFDYYNVLPGQGRYKNPILISKEERQGHTEAFDKTPGKIYQGHSTDVIADQALQWLQQQKGSSQPFMLMCHFKAPHRSWEYAERFSDLLNDVEIPEPQNLYDTYEGKAFYTQIQKMSLEDMNRWDLKCKLPTNLSRDEFRKWAYQRYIKDYLRCIAGIDENVGRILDFLDKNGLAENTIVVYTSDQGFFLGEHGWFDKRYMLEESLHMPLLIRYPKEIKAGVKNNSIVINADFAPTLLDYAGISKPDYMQGESFREILKKGDKPKGWRDAMYYRYWMHGENAHYTVANYGIRTERYKLIYYYGKPLGKKGTSKLEYQPDWELFDLKNDPMEMRNIYHEKKYQKLIQKLKKRLYQLKEMYGDNE
ncbi:sulfatase [Bacteroides sp.]|uniref:sulfatase family protein n=1 Tax=Bacteroides sp. TaxID=29523 RepID=UPI002609C4C2|nr:sulfatase [Bacteroides sp.]MDD3037395.1 sulfatase [Bacteroides sp.]